MYRTTGILCAAGMLLLSAGCWLDRQDVQADATVQGNNGVTSASETYVNGSLESVSVSTQNALRHMGLAVDMAPQGQDVRLSSATRSGLRFILVLSRHQTPMGEQTRFRIVWENKAEALFLDGLMNELIQQSAPPVSEGPPR